MTDDLTGEMIERAKERLRAASVLLNENIYGESISTAYYAVFDAARLLLELEKVTTKTHAGAIAKFNELFVKTGKIPAKFSKIFRDMENSRLKADYNFQSKFTREDAEHAVSMAEEFIKEIERFL